MADESPADVTSQEETSQEEGIIELSSADTPAQTQATSSNTEGGPEGGEESDKAVEDEEEGQQPKEEPAAPQEAQREEDNEENLAEKCATDPPFEGEGKQAETEEPSAAPEAQEVEDKAEEAVKEEVKESEGEVKEEEDMSHEAEVVEAEVAAKEEEEVAKEAEATGTPVVSTTQAEGSSDLVPEDAAAAPPQSPPSAPPPAPSPQAPLSLASHSGYRAIDVEVSLGPTEPYKLVHVAIDHTQVVSKAFLGGFKNKKNGVVYHHASTQTPKVPKHLGAARKHEHETQTAKQVQTSVQVPREASTQMERGLKQKVLIDTSKDKVLAPRPYQTAEDRLKIVVAAACVIQRYWRGHMGRSKAASLARSKADRESFQREEEAKAKRGAEEHRKREIERRMEPRTPADFEILYKELEAWRFQETRKIKQAGLPKEREQEMLRQLLHKETKLLQTIDRLKIGASQENKSHRIQKTLREMGKPKVFELKDGQTVEVHTPFTTRAMELMQLYNGLNLTQLTVEERLDVLLHVKWTVKEFDCNLTREIVDLIEREADLVNRGRSQKLLEGLRKRISSSFLTFIETPEFNPQASSLTMTSAPFEQFLFDNL